jgi:hypothetical protein
MHFSWRRVPGTRAVEYRPDTEEGGKGGDEMDVDSELQSGIDTRRSKAPVAARQALKLEPWDDGGVLGAGSLAMFVDLGDSIFSICVRREIQMQIPKKPRMSKEAVRVM